MYEGHVIVNDFYPVTAFTKRAILGIWQGSEYASDCIFTGLSMDAI